MTVSLSISLGCIAVNWLDSSEHAEDTTRSLDEGAGFRLIEFWGARY